MLIHLSECGILEPQRVSIRAPDQVTHECRPAIDENLGAADIGNLIARAGAASSDGVADVDMWREARTRFAGCDEEHLRLGDARTDHVLLVACRQADIEADADALCPTIGDHILRPQNDIADACRAAFRVEVLLLASVCEEMRGG